MLTVSMCGSQQEAQEVEECWKSSRPRENLALQVRERDRWFYKEGFGINGECQ